MKGVGVSRALAGLMVVLRFQGEWSVFKGLRVTWMEGVGCKDTYRVLDLKDGCRVLVFYGGCRVLGVSFRDEWRMESQLGLFIFMILVARGRQMI